MSDAWTTLKQALRGSGGDLTSGPVGRAVVLLAVPMVMEMLMESVFAVVDIAFVSRLGASATAAVGLTESLLTIVYTVALGLSIGTTSMVARRIGERNEEEAVRTVVQALALGVVAATVLGIVGGWSAPTLLRWMGADAAVVATGAGFATIMLGGNGVILLLFLINAAFRGAGDAAFAMRILWLANGINLVLDPCLIFGLGPFPELGVTGAAVATTTGRGIGVLAQLVILFFGSGRLRLRTRHLALRARTMATLLRLSATGAVQMFIDMASWIGLVRLIALFGDQALAGYTIAIRIVLFALLPASGLGNAAATMVGQSLGARDAERAERSVWIAGTLNLAYLALAGAVFVAAAPAIVALFGADAVTSRFAVQGLRTISAGFLFYAYGMVIGQSFNGAGDTRTPTLLNLYCFWLLEIPLAWTLARWAGWGPQGAFVAITVAFCTYAAAAAVLFRRGRWKHVVV